MPTDDYKKAVDQLRCKLKSTRTNLALITTLLAIDSKEMHLSTFLEMLDRIYYNPFLLKAVLEENA